MSSKPQRELANQVAARRRVVATAFEVGGLDPEQVEDLEEDARDALTPHRAEDLGRAGPDGLAHPTLDTLVRPAFSPLRKAGINADWVTSQMSRLRRISILPFDFQRPCAIINCNDGIVAILPIHCKKSVVSAIHSTGVANQKCDVRTGRPTDWT